MEGIHGKTVIKDDDQCYILQLEGDLKFEDVIGPNSMENVTRKEFLVRYVFDTSNEACKLLKRVQKASGATIAVISTSEVELHCQARMELWGTADQIKIAESAFVRGIKKLYNPWPVVSTLLMQTPIYLHEVYIPISQCINLVGSNFENIMKLEAESGAWIELDLPWKPSPRHLSMSRLKIFGTREQVYKVLMIVNEALLEPFKPVPIGTEQAADDMVLDHQLLVDSNAFVKEQTAKVRNTKVVDYATINDDELRNEYDVFLKKLQGLKLTKFRIQGTKKNPWSEFVEKWPTPQSYRPVSPAYILTSYDAEISPPNFISASNPRNASYSSPRPTPLSYSPTSAAYMFTSNVYIPIPCSNPYDYPRCRPAGDNTKGKPKTEALPCQIREYIPIGETSIDKKQKTIKMPECMILSNWQLQLDVDPQMTLYDMVRIHDSDLCGI